MLIEYSDLTEDDFEIHKPDDDLIHQEMAVDENAYDLITGLSVSEDIAQDVSPDSSNIFNEVDILTNYSPELESEDSNSQSDQLTRKVFVKTIDSVSLSNSDMDEFDLMNGQNNSSNNPHDDQVFLVGETEADLINL